MERSPNGQKVEPMDAARKADEGHMDGDPYVSVNEAARAIGVTPATVRSLALRKELTSAGPFGGRVFITRASVAEYKAKQEAEKAEKARIASDMG